MGFARLLLAAEYDYEPGSIPPLLIALYVVVILVALAGMWKVFVKAGQPGWGAIVPIYNAYLLCKIAGKPGWWVLLLLIPIVNLVIAILVAIGVATNFGKGGGFAVGLVLLGFVFYPILGFGSAQYKPVGTTA
jgi:hypothetical protein